MTYYGKSDEHRPQARNSVRLRDARDVCYAISVLALPYRIPENSPPTFSFPPVMTNERIGPVDIVEIIRHMPHRYPFIMVDRAIDGEVGKWIRAIKNVTNNETYFAGLPADRRWMPRVLLIEALAQCTGVLCHFSGLSKPEGRTLTFFAGLDHCAFNGAVAPGDQIVFECHLKRAMRGIVKFRGTGTVEKTQVISVELTAALRDRD